MTAIIVIWGGGLMLLAGLYCISGLTMGAHRLRRRMARNRALLSLRRRQQIGLPLGPVMPSRHRNGHQGASAMRYSRRLNLRGLRR